MHGGFGKWVKIVLTSVSGLETGFWWGPVELIPIYSLHCLGPHHVHTEYYVMPTDLVVPTTLVINRWDT